MKVRRRLMGRSIEVEMSQEDAEHLRRAEADMEQMKAQARAERRWDDYLFYFCSFDRWDAFREIAPHLDDAEYWEQLREAWLMSDGLHLGLWRLLTARRSKRDLLMTVEDHAALAALPETVTIHRGLDECVGRGLGYSWSLDINVAKRFAWGSRFPNKHPYLLTGQISKRHIRALFLGRKESEVLVAWRHVRVASRQSFGPVALGEELRQESPQRVAALAV